MGFQPEHGAVFKLDSTTGGSLVDYSSHVTQITPPNMNNNIQQFHTIDSRIPKTTIGGWTGSFTISVVRDPSPTSLHRVLQDWQLENPPGSRTVQIDMPDSDPGSERISGEVIIQSYTPGQVSGGSGNASIGQAQLAITGTFTVSTIS